MKELAQIAFEASVVHHRGQPSNLVPDEALWNGASDDTKARWRYVAKSVTDAVAEHFRALARVAITPERGAVLEAAGVIVQALATGEHYPDEVLRAYSTDNTIDWQRVLDCLSWRHSQSNEHRYVGHQYDGEYVIIACLCRDTVRLHVQALEPYRLTPAAFECGVLQDPTKPHGLRCIQRNGHYPETAHTFAPFVHIKPPVMLKANTIVRDVSNNLVYSLSRDVAATKLSAHAGTRSGVERYRLMETVECPYAGHLQKLWRDTIVVVLTDPQP